MTPYQLNLHINAYSDRIKEEQKQQITVAYLTAALSRVKKMPKLDELINEPKKKMTDEEMFEEIKKINIQMGGMTY